MYAKVKTWLCSNTNLFFFVFLSTEVKTHNDEGAAKKKKNSLKTCNRLLVKSFFFFFFFLFIYLFIIIYFYSLNFTLLLFLMVIIFPLKRYKFLIIITIIKFFVFFWSFFCFFILFFVFLLGWI